MIKVYLLIGVWLLSTRELLAQTSKYTKIESDNNAVNRVPYNQKYQYDNYKPGNVAYNTGSTSTASLNYSFLLDEIHFINHQGDTLSLANEYLIKQVVVGQDTFYFQPKIGYLQVIASFNPIKLAVKQNIRVLRNEKQSGYDQSSAVSAIKQFSFYIDHNGQIKRLQPKGNMLLAKEKDYYIIDQNSRVLPANKATVLTVFQKFKDRVNAYLKTNKINFKQEVELKKLLAYCQGLANIKNG